MCWAGISILDGLPLCGRRVPAIFIVDDAYYHDYEDPCPEWNDED